VTHDTKGVALMNGFSASIMKAFISDEMKQKEEEEKREHVGKERGSEDRTKKNKTKEPIDPLTMMKKVVMKKSFDGLVVD